MAEVKVEEFKSQRLMKLEEVKELQERIAELQNEAAKAEAADKEDAIAECTAVARKWGFSIYELFGDRANNVVNQVVEKRRKAKYRNPADHSQTWSGTGKRSKWLTDALAAGGNLEDFLIENQK